jgi:hypothetical protein
MSIPKCISASYDLDICKSSFDGDKLYIRSWKKLICKYDYIKYNARFIMAVYDIKTKAGIDKDITLERLEKYKSRGFDIKLHPNSDDINKHIINAINSGKYLINRNNHDKIRYIEDGSIDLNKFYIE